MLKKIDEYRTWEIGLLWKLSIAFCMIKHCGGITVGLFGGNGGFILARFMERVYSNFLMYRQDFRLTINFYLV